MTTSILLRESQHRYLAWLTTGLELGILASLGLAQVLLVYFVIKMVIAIAEDGLTIK